MSTEAASLHRLPRGLGTIKPEGPKFVPVLPRNLSRPPDDCKDPENYRERLESCDTRDEAFRLLVAAGEARRADAFAPAHSIKFCDDAADTLDRLKSDALRRYRTEARANQRVSSEKGIIENWLAKEPWFELPTKLITQEDLQGSIERMMRKGRTKRDEPVSPSFVRKVAQFLVAVFKDRGIRPNPAEELTLPKKRPPKTPFWALREQQRFFGAAESVVPLRDRVQAGCGMGPGLRVSELAALEVDDLHLDQEDPHLVIRYSGADRGPTKGSRVRRVELFEPGLGFFRIWMERFYQDNPKGLVFAGPRGGFPKHWPDQFKDWGEALHLRDSTSHIMRHSYAVAMLSGTWGYEPQSLDFVSKQLGHADRTTTERYYGAFEQETFKLQVRRMTGQMQKPKAIDVVTAEKLLGLGLARSLARSGGGGAKSSRRVRSVVDSRHPPHDTLIQPKEAGIAKKDGPIGAVSPQSTAELAIAVLRAVEEQNPFVIARAIDLAERVLQDEAARTFDADSAAGGVG